MLFQYRMNTLVGYIDFAAYAARTVVEDTPCTTSYANKNLSSSFTLELSGPEVCTVNLSNPAANGFRKCKWAHETHAFTRFVSLNMPIFSFTVADTCYLAGIYWLQIYPVDAKNTLPRHFRAPTHITRDG